MPRLSTILGVSLLLSGACTESRRGEKDAGAELGLTPLPPMPIDAATEVHANQEPDAPVTSDASVVVDPSRLQEARALIPAPLLYGEWRPVMGAWVDYEVISHEHLARVRISLVGETKRKDGTTLYQLELNNETVPPSLVVLWLRGGEHPFVERLAVSMPPHAPLSIPVDLHIDQPELRGFPTKEQDMEVRQGLFAGKVRMRAYARDGKTPVVVMSTERVPLLGVKSVRDPETTWTVTATGTGAKPSLDMVPIAIPRVPGQ
ncbi:hypothetical protein [Myxococcus landrumensis]|uniref:Lipoprotein n=1 Tax=Myxococcus landrumensis TaxID=2813577 RepID=A0ABX7MY26_9BACT|nr:hypothetical protein [Myxococcus landrumus]QSQ11196.1 hypothetical protein JY572_22525 [Myxococcus landrumus]